MSFLKEDSQQDYLSSIQLILDRAESAERELSYLSSCGSEQVRKDMGSYYTPIDVARFFWNEFFSLSSICDTEAGENLIDKNDFVEPAVGAGALFFALIEKLIKMGVDPKFLAKIRVELIDVNKRALSFVEESLRELEDAWKVKFNNVKFALEDFREKKFKPPIRPKVFFGNPPFVANQRAESNWKNLYADFVEISLKSCGLSGAIHFIVPLSLAFSRDYHELRNFICSRGSKLAISNFDNIPDTLFKSGKPRHNNTNKANSQRCSILSILPSAKPMILSTQLHRWPRRARHSLLTTRPEYFDITEFKNWRQFIRPRSSQFLKYYRTADRGDVLGDLQNPGGRNVLYVAAVARNFIGIRPVEGPGTQSLKFRSSDDFMRTLVILTSDLFMDYWLSVGDGFHVTRSNLVEFPISVSLRQKVEELLPKARELWSKKEQFAKQKLNTGNLTKSFDFSGSFPTLY